MPPLFCFPSSDTREFSSKFCIAWMQCRANYVTLRPRTLGARDLGNQIVDALELGESTKAKPNLEKRENVRILTYPDQKSNEG